MNDCMTPKEDDGNQRRIDEETMIAHSTDADDKKLVASCKHGRLESSLWHKDGSRSISGANRTIRNENDSSIAADSVIAREYPNNEVGDGEIDAHELGDGYATIDPDQRAGDDGDDNEAGSKPPRKKKRTWRKPKDKPKRPLSAYNLFFKRERERIISQSSEDYRPVSPPKHAPSLLYGKSQLTKEESPSLVKKRRHRRSHGKIGFADLARTISQKWKEIEPKTRKAFEDEALKERQRYDREVAKWKLEQKWKDVHSTSASDACSEEHFGTPHQNCADYSADSRTSKVKEFSIGTTQSSSAPPSVDGCMNCGFRHGEATKHGKSNATTSGAVRRISWDDSIVSPQRSEIRGAARAAAGSNVALTAAEQESISALFRAIRGGPHPETAIDTLLDAAGVEVATPVPMMPPPSLPLALQQQELMSQPIFHRALLNPLTAAERSLSDMSQHERHIAAAAVFNPFLRMATAGQSNVVIPLPPGPAEHAAATAAAVAAAAAVGSAHGNRLARHRQHHFLQPRLPLPPVTGNHIYDLALFHEAMAGLPAPPLLMPHANFNTTAHNMNIFGPRFYGM